MTLLSPRRSHGISIIHNLMESRNVYTVKEVNKTTTAHLRCALVLVGPYPSLQEFFHLIFYRIVPSIPFLSLSHMIHTCPTTEPGAVSMDDDDGVASASESVRCTSRLLRRYVTRTEPELARSPGALALPHWQQLRRSPLPLTPALRRASS